VKPIVTRSSRRSSTCKALLLRENCNLLALTSISSTLKSHVAKFDLSMDIRVSTDAVTCTARYDGALISR